MNNAQYSAFSGFRLIASGDLKTVLSAVKAFSEQSPESFLIFDHSNGRQVDFDLRGSIDEVMAKAAPEAAAKDGVAEVQKAGKGRPKLGVVAGEVTLLPRHWEWLAAQPLKASGTIRRLIEEARAKESVDPKKRREALGTLLWSLAGDLPNFEEASRALYAGDCGRFAAATTQWPEDVRRFANEWLAGTQEPAEGK